MSDSFRHGKLLVGTPRRLSNISAVTYSNGRGGTNSAHHPGLVQRNQHFAQASTTIAPVQTNLKLQTSPSTQSLVPEPRNLCFVGDVASRVAAGPWRDWDRVQERVDRLP
jgi:hypothetical protein